MNYLRKADQTIDLVNSMMKSHAVRPGGYYVLQEIIYNLSVLRSKILIWMENGEKTFILTKELIEAFKHTDIPWSLTADNFNYPFDVFMIEGNDTLFETNFIGHTPRKVNGILFFDNKILLNDPNVHWVGHKGEEVPKPDWNIALTGLFVNPKDGLESIMMHMRRGETIEQSAATRKPGVLILPMEEEDTKNMANIFFNTVLYINDPTRIPSDTEKHGVRSVKNIKTGKFHDQKFITLSVPKDYESLSHEERKIDKRFVVRGHWWPRLSNTESQKPRRWVFPFWKGPELSEIISKPYKVE
jgi:hypothetical protein